MALRALTPDPVVVEVVRANLAHLVGRPEFRDRATARANPLELALAVPHGVHTLGLDDLVAEVPLTRARLVAHRFLVLDGASPVASAEVGVRPPTDGAAAPDSSAGALTGPGTGFMLTEGPFVSATVDAVQDAERRAGTRDAEVRLLRIPALHVMALWLHGTDERDDEFTPMRPAPAPLEAGRPYAATDLRQELARMARPLLDSGPEAGG